MDGGVVGLSKSALTQFVNMVLAEDLGTNGDITSQATIEEDARLNAVLTPRHDIVVAGLPLAEAFFQKLDPAVRIERLASDGERLTAGTALLRLTGLALPILAAERSALNALQHLSGIATMTRQYVDRIAGTSCILLDTRKTIPGLRAVEKYAARMGGASNHRMRLDDGVLIKDNHIAVAGTVEALVKRAKSAIANLPVQVEVDHLEQIEAALAAGADSLLCDNMDLLTLRRAVVQVAGRVPIEASGGVRLDSIRAIAETGVRFVSVGRITQSAPAADIGLDYQVCVPSAVPGAGVTSGQEQLPALA
ncbi:carboxylating nicotinate-nucleotide diphosphorylase [Novosphingobium aquimarinum]|uniref:carboxylating nicotinate-nucleotide diphosphorylase n=1 Tax=Novosphingobium aquimarinum TaxID=2682494 RepID=UPI0012EBE016|nr:carboxylating nicotinate-nucleotide diphosphorylase [Novosphingobium aquimarinum]|tara:strand:- start:3553 stop:4473 length:921 start_codon:yes stop_codon:yes gene_type:complete